MKTKMLAVVAVLALAFAGFAVYAEQNDAVATPSAPIVTLGEGGTANVAITFDPTFSGVIPAGETPVFSYVSNNTTVVAETGAVNYENGVATITCSAVGVVTVTLTLTYGTGETAVVGSDNVTIYVYANADDVKIIGYAKATVGAGLNQVIFYDDGTALVNIGNDLGAQHATATVGSQNFIVGLSDRFTINFQGMIDVANIDGFTFSLAGDYTSSQDLGTFDAAPYAVTFDVNSDAEAADFSHAHAAGEAAVREVAITTATTAEVTTDFELTLEKGAAINTINATVGDAEVPLSDLITPVNAPLLFKGFAADDEATSGFMPVAAMTIENFIFGLVTATVGSGDAAVETTYATWATVYFKVWISNGAETPAYAQGEQTVATSYTVKAPRVAITDDILTIQITQTAGAVSTYQIAIYGVGSYTDAGVPVPSAEPITGDFYLRMLTNGIWAASGTEGTEQEPGLPGITGDVIIVVTPATGTVTTGYQFGMDSVSNDADVGTAVAKLTVFDAQLAGTITMGGTYYYVEDEARIFGNIQNLIGAGSIGYNVVTDGVAAAATAFTGASVTAEHSNYTISLVNVDSGAGDAEVDYGFYAVKAIYTPGATGAQPVQTDYMLA